MPIHRSENEPCWTVHLNASEHSRHSTLTAAKETARLWSLANVDRHICVKHVPSGSIPQQGAVAIFINGKEV